MAPAAATGGAVGARPAVTRTPPTTGSSGPAPACPTPSPSAPETFPHLPLRAAWLCGTHWWRNKYHGDPTSGPHHYQNPLDAIAGRTVRDHDTGCLLWTGSTTGNGYGVIRVNRKPLLVHRYVWEQAEGSIPDGKYVDHICYQRACAELTHLRLATKAENGWNREGPTSISATGARGVSPIRFGRYRARVSKGGIEYRAGTFDSIHEAAQAAAALRADLFGEFAGRGTKK